MNLDTNQQLGLLQQTGALANPLDQLGQLLGFMQLIQGMDQRAQELEMQQQNQQFDQQYRNDALALQQQEAQRSAEYAQMRPLQMLTQLLMSRRIQPNQAVQDVFARGGLPGIFTQQPTGLQSFGSPLSDALGNDPMGLSYWYNNQQ